MINNQTWDPNDVETFDIELIQYKSSNLTIKDVKIAFYTYQFNEKLQYFIRLVYDEIIKHNRLSKLDYSIHQDYSINLKDVKNLKIFSKDGTKIYG